jgi:hypothetical protein
MKNVKVEISDILPVSPLSLQCPHCQARPNKDCTASSGGFSVLHVERIQAAAAKDKAKKLFHENLSKTVDRILKGEAEK